MKKLFFAIICFFSVNTIAQQIKMQTEQGEINAIISRGGYIMEGRTIFITDANQSESENISEWVYEIRIINSSEIKQVIGIPGLTEGLSVVSKDGYIIEGHHR